MTVDDFIKANAAVLAWRAAAGDGANAMLGVLFVIRNKAKAGERDGNWLDILQRMALDNDYSVLLPDPREPSFQSVLQAVDGVYDDTLTDTLTDGATHYSYGGKDSKGLERVSQIGNVVFYK